MIKKALTVLVFGDKSCKCHYVLYYVLQDHLYLASAASARLSHSHILKINLIAITHIKCKTNIYFLSVQKLRAILQEIEDKNGFMDYEKIDEYLE